jgi:hypothetical protein
VSEKGERENGLNGIGRTFFHRKARFLLTAMLRAVIRVKTSIFSCVSGLDRFVQVSDSHTNGVNSPIILFRVKNHRKSFSVTITAPVTVTRPEITTSTLPQKRYITSFREVAKAPDQKRATLETKLDSALKTMISPGPCPTERNAH